MTMNPGTPGLPVAGWYTDPQNAAQLRWWDGTQWTSHTSAVPQPIAPAPAAVAEPVVAPAVDPSPAYAPRQGVPQYGEYSTPAQQATAAQPAAAGAGAAAASVASAMPTYAAQPHVAQQPYAGQPASAQPYGMAPMQQHVPAGTPTTNWLIWLLVLLPLLSTFSIFAIDIDSYVRASLTDPYASTTMMFSPAYVLVSLGGWVLYGGMVVLAYFDWRWLGKQGYPRRFHWAWTFLSSLVYVIGRSVVVKKQADKGLAPMWVSILITALSFVIVGVWMAMLFNSMMTTFEEFGGVSGIPS